MKLKDKLYKWWISLGTKGKEEVGLVVEKVAVDCPDCQYGYVWVDCDECEGGWYDERDIFEEDEIPDWPHLVCEYCAGGGEMEVPCETCNGNGWVMVPVSEA